MKILSLTMRSQPLCPGLAVALFVVISLTSAAAEMQSAASGMYRDWKHSGSVFLLTTPDGATCPPAQSVEEFPVLVRLHSDFFDFRQAKVAR